MPQTRDLFVWRKHLTTSPRHFQSGQRSGAAAELVGGDAHPLQHAYKKIAQWRMIVFVEGQMLAVLEAAASQQHRHVLQLL